LEESDKIILDTSDKQKIQSKILMILHEENGFIQLEKLLEFSKEDLGELESMEEYISKFLNYLEKEELAMLVPINEEVKNLSDIDQIILWDALIDKHLIDFDITQFEKIEFRLENPIQIIELIFFGKKNLGRFEFINRNKLCFEGSEKIIFDLIDNEISSDSKHNHIKIYIKDSPEKKRIIIEFLGEKYLISSNSSISYSLDEYVELINEGECETIEFKSTFKWDIKESRANKELPEMVTKSICAFSNSRQGGIVFIGIKNDRSIFGIENDIEKIFHNSYDIFQQEVAKKIRKDLGQSVIYKTDKIELKNKMVFIIKVEPAKNPIYFKNNEYYVRRGSSNHNCTPKETEEHIKSRFP